MNPDTISAREAQETADPIGAPNQNLAVALEWAKAGYPVFPASPDKRPLVSDWQAQATTDEARIRHWWRRHPEAMPALPMGHRTGLAVLDVDRKNGKDGLAALRKLGHDPAALSSVTVATPTGGLHAYFRWPEGMGNSAAGLPSGVDVRGNGGYVIAPGAVGPRGQYRATGDDLVVLRLIGPEFAPEWPEALRPAIRQADDGPAAKPGKIGMTTLRSALMAIPNDGSLPEHESRDWWFKMGAGLHYETGGSADGLTLWHEWSAQWPGYGPDATDAAWRSYRRRDGALRTGATILAEARLHGWRDRDRIGARLDSAWSDDELADIMVEAPVGTLPDKAMRGGQPDDSAGNLVMLTPDDCAIAPGTPYVVKGLVAQGNVVSIVGAPGVGKSVVAPYLAYAVAQGRQAFGMRTKPGKVFYLATENESDMRKRVHALRRKHGPADDFRLILEANGRFRDSAFLRKLRAAIERERPKLIVVDTLAAAMPGFEENSSEGMGEAIAVARSLTKWGAAVVLVHHDTKAGDSLPRGHGSLHGDVDMNLALTRGAAGSVLGAASKNRNGPSHERIVAYRNAVVTLGHDDDGDQITTVICEERDVSEVTIGPKLTASAAAALAVWERIATGGNGSVAESDWRSACVEGREVSAAEDADSRRKAFKRASEELIRRKLLVFREGRYSRVQSVDPSDRFTDADV